MPHDSLATTLEAQFHQLPISGLTVVLEDYDISTRQVELVNIEASPRNCGAGTAAMQRLTGLADNNQITLMLILAGEPTSDKRGRLAQFYDRFGFEEQECGEIMRRSPSVY